MNCMDCKRKNQENAPQVVAMAYVPVQTYGNIYTPEVGWTQGTIFPELDKPLEGKRGNCNGR